MPKLNLEELERLYQEGIQTDESVYAEMRSNILLVSGEHYSRKRTRLYQTLRDTRNLNERQKLRLVKNHMHKISRIYQENISSFTPGVTVLPANETERQDQKAAQLARSVWTHIKKAISFEDLKETLVQNFVDVGEIAVLGYFDETKGKLKGYEQAVDDFGEPAFDEMGNPVPDEARGIFEGEICFEEVFGFDLFRPVEAKSYQSAKWIGIRKMVDIPTLKKQYGEDDERVKKLTEEKEEFVVFDMTRNAYEKSKNQTVWKEIYYKPCMEYPNGYYVMWTKAGVFHEGELPFGIYPLLVGTFDTYPTVPRGKASAIKIARPYQAEINRASSSQAMAQLTLGDDKVLYQAGTKIAPGGMLPGVRGITYQGQQPLILSGRDGGQYTDYILRNISEMYQAVMLEEENQENEKQGDPIALLLKSMRRRKKFAKYASRFERFLISFCELSLELARKYYDDDRMIQAVGRREIVNISEFKNSNPLMTQVSLEPVDDTIESKLGKHMTLTQSLQYIGKQLKPEDIGRILKEMPFVNMKEAFGDLTIDQENADNMMLALERGQYPKSNKYDGHEYIVKRLTKRMREADFSYLDPQIQAAYERKVKEHEMIMAEQQRQIMAAKSEMIPSDGPLVKADVYVGDPDNPEKQPKRAQIPQRALEWLIERLSDQGSSLEKLESMNAQNLAEMAQMIMQRGMPQASEQQGMLQPARPNMPQA